MSDVEIPTFPMSILHGSQRRVILNIVDGDIPPLSSYYPSPAPPLPPAKDLTSFSVFASAKVKGEATPFFYKEVTYLDRVAGKVAIDVSYSESRLFPLRKKIIMDIEVRAAPNFQEVVAQADVQVTEGSNLDT
jgi:hypothetical protein